jgi:hypothetical protein
MCLLCVASAQSARPAIAIVVSTPANEVKTGVNIQLEIVVTNISRHKITVKQTWGAGEATAPNHIIVRDGTDKLIPADDELEFRRFVSARAANEDTNKDIHETLGHIPTASDHQFLLKPGETSRQETSVTRFFNLSTPGKYIIQVERLDQDSHLTVKSNPIMVTVTP